jgi:hypothetical protein
MLWVPFYLPYWLLSLYGIPPIAGIDRAKSYPQIETITQQYQYVNAKPSQTLGAFITMLPKVTLVYPMLPSQKKSELSCYSPLAMGTHLG